MNGISNITAPASWVSHFATKGEYGQVSEFILSEVITDMFAGYFPDQRFLSLSDYEKRNMASFFKELMYVASTAEREATVHGRLETLFFGNELSDRLGNAWESLLVIRMLDSVFYGFLAEDSGHELRPDGYINTEVVRAKELMLDLIEDLMRYNFAKQQEEAIL